MINIEMECGGALLGDGGWKDQIHYEILQRTTVYDGDMLSEGESVTDFVVLHPREAWVDESLRNVIAEVGRTLAREQQLALVRWKDDTESLVVFPASDAFPHGELLMAAYFGGYVAQATYAGIDLLWSPRRDLH